MSRKGNKIIKKEPSVEVSQADNIVRIKGKKGELEVLLRENFSVDVTELSLKIVNKDEGKNSKAYHGMYQSQIQNAVTGVTDGYSKELELFGVGYKVQKKGKGLEFSLGYSHPVLVPEQEGIDFETDGPTKLKISGIDKQKVGQVAAEIIKLRDARKDPYKTKGIKFKGAVIRRKAGKKVK